MIHKTWPNASVFILALCIAIFSSACTTNAPEPAPAHVDRPGTYSRFHFSNSDSQYTKADYDLALSFRSDNYKEMTVDAFNRSVLDWENEDAFHKTEESLQRLFWTLPEEDPNADFIFTTLSYTWDECRTKHYKLCERERNPSYSSTAKRETFGDIFGDPVVLTGGYADFCFDYKIPNGAALTVAQRDAALQGVDSEMQKFLDGQTEKALQDEKSMEKALLAELKQILEKLDGGLVYAATCDVSYDWNSNMEEEDRNRKTNSESAFSEPSTDTYTKEQYDLALHSLQFSNYENMTIAEFDRKINAAFMNDEEEDQVKSLNFAYEMITCHLPDNDPNQTFFHLTVPCSLEEYYAKTREVFSGKPADPEFSGRSSSYKEEDVFGDLVQTDCAEADYSFTYRILEPNQLTVRERDQFLTAVEKGAQEYLKNKLESGSITEADFKAGLEAAGKTASNTRITFTGCEIYNFDSYR